MSENLAQIHCMVVMIEFDYWKTLLDAWRASAKVAKQQKILKKYLHMELKGYIYMLESEMELDPDERASATEDDKSFGWNFLKISESQEWCDCWYDCFWQLSVTGGLDYYELREEGFDQCRGGNLAVPEVEVDRMLWLMEKEPPNTFRFVEAENRIEYDPHPHMLW